MTALHPMYDYRPHLEAAGLRETECSDFRVFPLLPFAYRNIVAVRDSTFLFRG